MNPRDHNSEIGLLAVIALGVIVLLIIVAMRGIVGWDVAACLLVLQGIITAIRDRWNQRSQDRMADQLGQSTPRSDAPLPVTVVNTPTDPVPVEPAT